MFCSVEECVEVCVAYILCVVGRRSVGTSGNSVEERDRKGENGSVGKIVEERENRRRERRERAAANSSTSLHLVGRGRAIQLGAEI